MKSIEIFNETNSNLNKAVNMAFEVTLINKLINTCKLYVKQHSAISMNLFETQ